MSDESKKVRRRVVVPRELLLVEVERYCRDPLCGSRNGVGLTKEEARAYTGFTCERCEREWPDALTERDVPEWWEELQIRSLERPRPIRAGESDASEGPVARMSEAWRAGGRGGNGEDESDGGEDSL